MTTTTTKKHNQIIHEEKFKSTNSNDTPETLLSCDYDRDLVIEVKEYFGFSFSEAVEYLEDNYVGEYENLGEWAEDFLFMRQWFLNETGQLCDLDKNLIYCFDYDAYGRYSEINGDILHLAGHVLYNN